MLRIGLFRLSLGLVRECGPLGLVLRVGLFNLSLGLVGALCQALCVGLAGLSLGRVHTRGLAGLVRLGRQSHLRVLLEDGHRRLVADALCVEVPSLPELERVLVILVVLLARALVLAAAASPSALHLVELLGRLSLLLALLLLLIASSYSARKKPLRKVESATFAATRKPFPLAV